MVRDIIDHLVQIVHIPLSLMIADGALAWIISLLARYGTLR